MKTFFFYAVEQGLKSTPRRPNASREAISSGPRSYFVNNGKMIYSIYQNFVDLVECNVSRNNHMT